MTEPEPGWPSEFAERYRAAGHWAGTTLGERFAESVRTNAERIAVVDRERRTTYRELGRLVDRLATALAARGICRGATVVFQLPNVLEFVVAYFACLRVGAVPLACHPSHRHTEIQQLATLTKAAAWIFPSELRGFDHVAMAEQVRRELPALRELFVVGARAAPGMTLLSELLAEPGAGDDPRRDAATARELDALRPRPSDCAVFQLSGGTTGLPKVIPRTHDDYLYNSLRFAEVSGFDRDSVLLVSLPVAHNFPLACPGIQAALLLGARVVLASSPSPDVVFPLIERESVTWIPAVPATVITWTNDPGRARHDLRSIRTLAVGGQRLSAGPAAAAIAAFGDVLCQVYGMAEGLLCCTRAGDPEEVVLGTQGRPISADDEVRIVDAAGRDVAPGEAGELLCRGPYTIRGYHEAEAHNRVAFTADGFYRTGDVVRAHPSGNYVVEGRSKDMINRGGEKISAEEVENLLLTHPSVLDAAVVAMPDPVLGERACAFVVTRPGEVLTLEDLRTYLTLVRPVASFKRPDRLEIRERLPSTAVGKVSKAELREEIAKLVSR